MSPTRNLLVLILLGWLVDPLAAQVTITKIADDSTPIPNAPGTFITFGLGPREAPTLTGLNSLVFFGAGQNTDADGLTGYYSFTSGSLQRIVNGGTIQPDTGAPFGLLDSRGQGIGSTAYFKNLSSATQNLYSGTNNVAQYLVGDQTLVPGTGEHFEGVVNWAAGSVIAFTGSSSVLNRFGIYQHNAGTVTTILDNTMPLPGGSALASSDIVATHPVVSGARTAFNAFADGTDAPAGVYLHDAGQTQVIADTSTQIPGRSFAFRSFFTDTLAISNNNVVFVAQGNDANDSVTGFFARINGVLTEVATDALGFTQYNSASIDGNRIAFTSEHGLTLWQNGQFTQILSLGDQLDGREIAGIGLSYQGLSGDQVAIRVTYNESGFPEGIYLISGIASVPEPSTYGLLALTGVGAVGVSVIRGRQRRKARETLLSL